MSKLSRRSLLAFAGSGILALPLLAGCATTQTGHLTTTTIEVAKIEQYVEAGLNAAETVASVLALLPAVSSYAPALHNAAEFLKTASAAFSDAVGGQITVDYSDANWKARVDSILSSIKTMVGVLQDILTSLTKAGFSMTSDTTVMKVQLAHDALATVLSIFEALVAPQLTFSPRPASIALNPVVKVSMTETQALRTLRV